MGEFVAGAWKIERQKDVATLNIETFENFLPEIQAEIAAEGERLVRFVEDDCTDIAIVFQNPQV